MKPETAVESKSAAKGKSPIFVETEKLFEEMEKIYAEVSKQAYKLFEARGGEDGQASRDWLLAESQLLRTTPMEVTETEREFKVTVEVPGFKAEEIKVSVEPYHLIINGKTEKVEEKKEEEKVIFSERQSNQFLRETSLPVEVDTEKVTATLSDGVLTLVLPKTEPVSTK